MRVRCLPFHFLVLEIVARARDYAWTLRAVRLSSDESQPRVSNSTIFIGYLLLNFFFGGPCYVLCSLCIC